MLSATYEQQVQTARGLTGAGRLLQNIPILCPEVVLACCQKRTGELQDLVSHPVLVQSSDDLYALFFYVFP